MKNFYFFSLQRIEINETVDLIFGNEKNPCLGPSKMNWYDWMVGRDSRSACRDFLAYVHNFSVFFPFKISLFPLCLDDSEVCLFFFFFFQIQNTQ